MDSYGNLLIRLPSESTKTSRLSSSFAPFYSTRGDIERTGPKHGRLSFHAHTRGEIHLLGVFDIVADGADVYVYSPTAQLSIMRAMVRGVTLRIYEAFF